MFIVVVVVRGRRSDGSNNCHTDAAASRHALRRCPVAAADPPSLFGLLVKLTGSGSDPLTSTASVCQQGEMVISWAVVVAGASKWAALTMDSRRPLARAVSALICCKPIELQVN